MIAAVRHELRLAAIAWQFLTRWPLPDALARRVGYRDAWLNASARHFPLVGAVVGAIGAAVLWVGALALPPMVAVGLSIAATVLLTGGFHEDGWADVCDGLGGTQDRQRALEIMKDSRIGAFGAMGLVLMLGLKWVALASMPAVIAAASLVLAHAASRTAAVMLIRALPYAGDALHAKAKPLARQLSASAAVVATLWSGLVALVLLRVLPVALLAWALAPLSLMTVACLRWFRVRLGGYTGDCLGAAQQLTELAAYLGILAGLQWNW